MKRNVDVMLDTIDFEMCDRDRYMTRKKLKKVLKPLYKKYFTEKGVDMECNVRQLTCQYDESARRYVVDEGAERTIGIHVNQDSDLPPSTKFMRSDREIAKHDVELRYPGEWKWQGISEDSELGIKIKSTLRITYRTEFHYKCYYNEFDDDFSCEVDVLKTDDTDEKKLTTLNACDLLQLTSMFMHTISTLPMHKKVRLFQSVKNKMKGIYFSSVFLATFKTIKNICAGTDEIKCIYVDAIVFGNELIIYCEDIHIAFLNGALQSNCLLHLEADTIHVKARYEEMKEWEIREDSLEEVSLYNACKLLCE